MAYQPPEFPPKTYVPRIDIAARFDLPAKTTVVLHPRRGHVPDPFSSKMGGRFAWPATEPWPECEEHGDSIVTILQLRKGDVPELDFPGNANLFQMLWCPEDHASTSYGPLVQVRWRVTTDIALLLERGSSTRTPTYCGTVPKECVLFPERVQEIDRYVGDRYDEIDAWVQENGQEDYDALKVPQDYREGAFDCHFCTAPGTKIGGFLSTVQDPWTPTCACGKFMSYLLTVSGDDIGDGVSSYRWAPDDITRAEDGKVVFPSYKGSDLCIGDCGGVYVFICRECDSLPIQSEFQCC